ncbi:hypothetical protein AB0O87_06970 [Microbacterium sp. NPDC076768]|uniref:hypothetical protein n=1 Tax=Microbacterium sp. NPDC076768 TaxID=3154858 RepID=UPI00341AF5C9
MFAATVALASLLLAPSAATAAAISVPAHSPVAAAVSSGESLSDTGEAAIADLRVCLASRDTLNVYYLIDSSRSLKVADDGGAGSDPDTLRASILGNSLEQLGALRDGLAVNWAAGFFSNDFEPSSAWSSWDSGSSGALAAQIKAQQPSGYTNWPAGLAGAQESLAAQQAADPGCPLLIWLTDGEMDIRSPDGPGEEDAAAFADMCSADGVFNSFRQSGVVVLGALLAVGSSAVGAVGPMQSLVEGESPQSDQQCGVTPQPESYVHGAFATASAPDSLARVFLELGAQVDGGYPRPFEADGSFWIDEGVARFRIVLAGEWTLTPPDGSGLSAASHDTPQEWAGVDEANGATVIEVRESDAVPGKWRLDSTDARSLFLFSDLRIVFDDTNTIELSDDGTAPASASLNATVVDTDGAPVDLDVYGESVFTASFLDAEGGRTELSGARIDRPTGTITIPVPSDLTAAQLVVTASIDPLVTREHGAKLAAVTVQNTIELTLPAAYPSVKSPPVVLSDLEGAGGQASGVITFVGPTEGGDGVVCLPGDPTVISDASNRTDWQWGVDSSLDAAGCVIVPANGEQTVEITAENAVAADSLVQASLPVTFQSADSSGEPLRQDIPVQFRSTHPVNTIAVVLVTLALLALGILIPLIILWIINWVTTRIDVPRDVQRASFPVRITAAGSKITAPRAGSALSDAFVFGKPSDGQREIRVGTLGTLRARVPWWPLRAPWYEVEAPAGSSIVAARVGRTASGVRDAKGRIRFAKLPLDRFWAVVVSDNELRNTPRGADVNGTVVFYHRAKAGDEGQLSQRLSEVENDSLLGEATNKARAALEQTQRRKSDGNHTKKPSDNAPQDRSPGAGSPPPPIPGREAGRAAPPPRNAPRAPQPGTPSPRSGATPPPPPPRPGTPPPPRP